MNIIKTCSENGTITLSNKYSGAAVLPQTCESGQTIFVIKNSACEKGQLTSLDLRNTQITEIQGSAFLRCYQLSKVYFPTTLAIIGSNSFAHTCIETLDLPESIVNIHMSAFNQDNALVYVSIDPNNCFYTSINGFLFNRQKTTLIIAPRNITSDSDIPLFDSLTCIGAYSLTCTHLKSFTGTKALSLIYTQSFHAMFYIKRIDLSMTSITSFPQCAVWGVTATQIILPSNMSELSYQSFYKNSYLKTVVISSNIESIANGAFYDCPSLSKIYYFGSKNFSTIEMFKGSTSSSLIRVYVSNGYTEEKFGKAITVKNWYLKCIFTCKHARHSKVPLISLTVILVPTK